MVRKRFSDQNLMNFLREIGVHLREGLDLAKAGVRRVHQGQSINLRFESLADPSDRSFQKSKCSRKSMGGIGGLSGIFSSMS